VNRSKKIAKPIKIISDTEAVLFDWTHQGFSGRHKSLQFTTYTYILLQHVSIYVGHNCLYVYIYILYTSKAVPLQAWNGREGSRKLRFPDFMKTAQNSGKVVSLTHRPPLPPGNTPGTLFC